GWVEGTGAEGEFSQGEVGGRGNVGGKDVGVRGGGEKGGWGLFEHHRGRRKGGSGGRVWVWLEGGRRYGEDR
ncbi:hypothetical protein Ancab_010341, partial [Ancistrocladus abbreviatus]